jgi:hypothetical protein
VLEDAPGRLTSCAAAEEIVLKAARLGYLDMNLVESYGDTTTRELLLEEIDKMTQQLTSGKG